MKASFPVLIERRTLPRAPCEVTTILYVGTEFWETTAHDICAGGLGVLWDRAVDLDTRLTVELFNPRGQFWHRKRLRIVHATPQDGNLWRLGSVFVQEFTPEELQALLDT